MIGLNKAAVAAGVFYCASAWPIMVQAAEIKQTIQPEHAQNMAPKVSSARFDDWFYRCSDQQAAGNKTVRSCEIVQVAQINQGGSNVNVLTLAVAKAAAPSDKGSRHNDLLLTVLVPLNVVLPTGFGLSTDGRDLITIPYRNCNQAGCWAQQKLDQKQLASLQKAVSGAAKLQLMNGQNINLKFSLKGFSKALDALLKPSKA